MGWRYWMNESPRQGTYEVIEWIRPYGDPEQFEPEPNVARLDELLAPGNNLWNVYGVYWRPVL